tara:strand:- start:9734 stop:10354 length:621 start_codon:yes stop_codon:yes gene_type:complete
MDEPRGLILFSNTPLGREQHRDELKEKILISSVISVIIMLSLYWFVSLKYLIIIVIIVFVLVCRNTDSSILNLPLAVNLNHPFMEQVPVSESEIMINLSGEWIHPGQSRLKLVKEDIRGWVVYKSDNDLTMLSDWKTKQKESVLNKKLTIINQAISLNNAVNDTGDDFEDARVREEQDSILLEREWLPEEELDVQGPLSRIFSQEQ